MGGVDCRLGRIVAGGLGRRAETSCGVELVVELFRLPDGERLFSALHACKGRAARAAQLDPAQNLRAE